jgi:hypothetical protein
MLKALLVAAGLVFAGQAAAQIRLFEDDGFQGRGVSANRPVENFADNGFNDKASSVQIRGGTWQACTDAYFRGQCVVLRPGNYASLRSMGLNDQISSIRPVERYGRRDDEQRDRHAERGWGRSYDDPYAGPRPDRDEYGYRGQ